MALSEIKPDEVTYYALNNEINIPVDGQIPLAKDKAALQAFLKENVIPNTKTFASLTDRLAYLVDHDYYEAAMLDKYQPAFLEQLNDFLRNAHFAVSYTHLTLPTICSV